jgi:hypothetical protein
MWFSWLILFSLRGFWAHHFSIVGPLAFLGLYFRIVQATREALMNA